MSKELSEKELAFIDAYLETFNATKSYELAGYSMNTKYTSKRAYEILNRPKVKEEIKRRLDTIRTDKDIMLQKLINKSVQLLESPDTKVSDLIRIMEYLSKLYSLGESNINVKSEGEMQFTFNIEAVDSADDKEENE